MPSHTTTGLSLMMEVLNISGKDLAQHVHVDDSLVSKWKNAKRTINPSHAQDIAAYLLTRLRETKNSRIQTTLKLYFPDINLENEARLLTDIAQHLSSPVLSKHGAFGTIIHQDEINDIYTTTYNASTSNKGRRHTVLLFLDHVLAMPQGQELLLMSQEDLSWIVEDRNFLQKWGQKLQQVLKQGHTISIIHYVDRGADSLSSILAQWLPLHLTGRTQSFYHPKYTDTLMRYSLFICKGALAVTGMSLGKDSSSRYTATHVDPKTVQHYENTFAAILSECQPLLQAYPPNDLKELYTKMMEADSIYGDSYLFAQTPLFNNLTSNTLRQILAENGLSESVKETFISRQEQSRNHFTKNIVKNSYRHCYSLDIMTQAMSMDRVYQQDLSLLCNHPVMISRAHFKENLQQLLNQLETHPNYEIALVSNSHFGHLQNINIWIKENSIVVASTADVEHQPPLTLSTTEPTITNAFYHFYNSIWDTIARINRSRSWVKERLQALIQMP